MCKNNLFADCGKYLQIAKAAQTEKHLDKIGNNNNKKHTTTSHIHTLSYTSKYKYKYE